MNKYPFDNKNWNTNNKLDKIRKQYNYEKEAFIIEQILLHEFHKFLNYTRMKRKEFLKSNKELKQFFKNKDDKIFGETTNSNKIFKSDSNLKQIKDILFDDIELQKEEISNTQFPGEKISNFRRYSDLNSVINLETGAKIPTGIFCYPCKENFRTEESFEIKHMVKIEKFEKFEEIMENVKPYFEWFSDYPHDKEESEKVENEFFVIYCFFKAISKIFSQHGKNEVNLKLKDLIQIFSNFLGKDFFVVYKILSKFWSNFKNKLKIEFNKNKSSSISKIREFYCQICFKYLCKIHFYNNYDFSVYSKSNDSDSNKIYKQELKKNSGNVTHINRTNFAMLNKLKSNNNLIQSFDNKFDTEKSFKCDKIIFSSCKLNHEICNENNFSIKDGNFYFNLFNEIRDKREFYLLCCLVISECLTNSCFISRFIFEGKYKCYVLNKIIAICQNETLHGFIDNYLNDNRSYNISEYSSHEFPQISKEKLKINYFTDIPYHSLKKTGKSISEKTDFNPCSHEGTCTRENCQCILYRGFCEKFCSCREYCEYQYKGCDCKDGCVKPEIDVNGEYKSNHYCKCLFDLRECDPDICMCRGVDVYYYNEDDYKKCLKLNKEGNGTSVIMCKNMPMNYRSFKLTILGRSILCDSYGLFAGEDIDVNELICDYTGEMLHKEETDRRTLFHEQLGLNYLFQLTDTIDIDAYRIGNEMRYVNHSSHGYQNCYARTKFVRGTYKICLYAERKIKKGEELFFDYLLKVNVPWLARYNRYYG